MQRDRLEVAVSEHGLDTAGAGLAALPRTVGGTATGQPGRRDECFAHLTA